MYNSYMSLICTYSHIQKNISEGVPYLVFHVEDIKFKHTNIIYAKSKQIENMANSQDDSLLVTVSVLDG